MPKKDKKASKQDKTREPADIVEAVRGAVERTLQATTGGTEGARDRGRNLLDDVASAAQRIRESFDDLRVLEDVRGLRAEVEALSRRVAELERKAAEPAKPGRAARARSTRAPAKPTAARTAAAKTTPKATPAGTSPTKAAASRRKPSAAS